VAVGSDVVGGQSREVKNPRLCTYFWYYFCHDVCGSRNM